MAFKKYNYALTEIAAYDIDEVISYIQEELSNPEAAISFADELEEKLEDICKNPKNGRLVEKTETYGTAKRIFQRSGEKKARNRILPSFYARTKR